MDRVQGIAAAPGVAIGAWTRPRVAPAVVGGRIDAGLTDSEIARLVGATEDAARALEAIADQVAAEGHPDEAAIFGAQAAISRDPALAALAAERIRDEQEDAIAAVRAAGASFADQLRALGDELLAARAADVLDVADRIARHLAGVADVATTTLDQPSIVVAEDLPPSVTATLPRDRLLGLALEGSSPTAHAAILARAYGIPAVVGARGLIAALEALVPVGDDAVDIAIDGSTGEIVIAPDAATHKRFEAGAVAQRAGRAEDVREAALPAATLDGTELTLLANIGTPDEAGPAMELGAQGVGLFRTEFLFLERTSPPSEDEQAEAYGRAVEASAPHPVTIRLLDVGGDKQIPYLPIAPEDNPFLGVRALRLAHDDPGLFVTQLRACLRAAARGPVKVMAPMVADAGDVRLLLELAEQARAGLVAGGITAGEIGLGVMLEIPGAILVADSYFGRLSFASLGTNDLLQYTLAVDRGNAALERYRDALHPALLRLVSTAVDRADAAGIDLSVCGEMAGDPVAALALAGLGIRVLSMAAPSLPAVRRALRATRMPDLQAAAKAALDDPDAAAVRARFEELVTPRSQAQ